MSEQTTKELAAHLSCILTTAQATIEKARQLVDAGVAGPGLVALVNDTAFRSLRDDVANANVWLAQQARATDAVRHALSEGAVMPPGTTLFPQPDPIQAAGLPDLGRRH